MSTYLTRGQAEDLIRECDGKLKRLLDLQEHWIGHRDVALSSLEPFDEVTEFLYSYVDERTLDGDHIRARGPSDADETDLTAPPEG
jgi:hypothetical protein